MIDFEFVGFPKTPRLHKEVIVTEKIDGTNAAVVITEDGKIGAQSRTRLISPFEDNFGFARWVHDNANELILLGPGHHFGEWWGSGIQRGYGLPKGEKRFSLFNVDRWADDTIRPRCCHVVPVLARGLSFEHCVPQALHELQLYGSRVAPGFMNPEGVMAYHTASRSYFKQTFGGDVLKGAA
jgi:RNA ligase-like protein